jgi:guanylate kinase
VPALIEMDVAGARQLRREMPGALLVFLVPASRAESDRWPASRPGEAPGRGSTADQAGLAAGSEFDITLVNASVQDVSGQLVALMTAQPAS